MARFITYSYGGPGPAFNTRREAAQAIKEDSDRALKHWHWRMKRDAALLAGLELPPEQPRALGLTRMVEVECD